MRLGFSMATFTCGFSLANLKAALSMRVLAAGEYFPLEIWKSGSEKCSSSFFRAGSPSLGLVEPEEEEREKKFEFLKFYFTFFN